MPLAPHDIKTNAQVNDLFQQGLNYLAEKDARAFKQLSATVELFESVQHQDKTSAEYVLDRFVCHYYLAMALVAKFSGCRINKAVVEALNHYVVSARYGATIFTADVYRMLGDANASWGKWGEAVAAYSFELNKLKEYSTVGPEVKQAIVICTKKRDAAQKELRNELLFASSSSPVNPNSGEKRSLVDATVSPAKCRP